MAAKLTVIEGEAAALDDLVPPRPLGKFGLAMWTTVQSEYRVDDAGGVQLLTLACEALDRAESLRAQIDRDGEIVRTKTGLKDHPGLKHELANRAFISRAIARLGLDVEPIRAVGRPSAGGYRG